MAAMRLQLRALGERVSEEEERYRLLPAQLPVRNAVCHCLQQCLTAHVSCSLLSMKLHHNVISSF